MTEAQYKAEKEKDLEVLRTYLRKNLRIAPLSSLKIEAAKVLLELNQTIQDKRIEDLSASLKLLHANFELLGAKVDSLIERK